MLEREEPRKVVSRLLEELARIIGLVSGEILITISDSKAVKIEARQHVRVCCLLRRENAWDAPGEDCGLVMDRAADFVMLRLETLVVTMVGRFGYLEAEFKQREVTALLINTSFTPPRGPGRRSGAPSH